jgi:putative phosphoribosyl transferase
MIFADRAEAGRLLAERVAELGLSEPFVIGLPRGGVPVAAEVAARLGAPLDVGFVRKIGAPGEPELAIGAVADGDNPEIVLNDDLVRALGLAETYVAAAAMRELAIIEQRHRDYAASRPPRPSAGANNIVVDDGVATGMTMQAALRQLRRSKPGRLVAAAPVASRAAIRMLLREADDVVCLSSPRRFRSVGSSYRMFAQVSDEEVMELLRAAAARLGS